MGATPAPAPLLYRGVPAGAKSPGERERAAGRGPGAGWRQAAAVFLPLGCRPGPARYGCRDRSPLA